MESSQNFDQNMIRLVNQAFNGTFKGLGLQNVFFKPDEL